MGKKRVLSSKMRSSQKFGLLTYRQRDLWQGLIVIADDQGRLPGTPAYVRSHVWTYDDINLDEVASDLARLEEAGSIVIYHVKDSCYIQIVNWWKYQTMQWAGSSDYPPPDNWVDRERYHGIGNEIFTKNWKDKGGFSILPNALHSQLPSEQSYTAREEDVKGNDEGNDEEELNGVTADAEPPKPAPKPKKGKERDPLLDNPAIIAYRDEVRLHVPIPWREEVCKTVDDPDRWKELVHEWIGHGWNKQNISGMLQAYTNGGIGKKKEEPAGFEAIRSYRQKAGLDNG